MLAGPGQDLAKADAVLQGFGELPAHLNVHPAFEALRLAGVRIIALTNGGAETTEHLLRRSRREGFVERTIWIDDVRHWKPHREVYLHAARIVAVTPTSLALVAAHAWDILGATRAGLTTGWISERKSCSSP